MMDTIKNALINIDEAAEIAQCNRQTIYRMCERGQIKARKFGKFWKIDRRSFYAQLGIEVQNYAQIA